MIPSLVAQHLRRSIVEYLSTTFALADDETRHGLADFLADPVEGIFRGPYLRVRTPFVSVDDGWKSPLAWTPDDFTPFVHQASAWSRLSTFGHEPEPTLVTTGTGSGKTECFLFPILDHCVRERAAGRSGIKALILYPMNALATDQARRLAELLATEAPLAGLTAGLFIGGKGQHKHPTAEHLIDDANVLRDNPPDILLTNYKMLDRLLVRADRHALWAGNDPTTLRYVVLDEFHTYDGAQGTDVAMLLRRLGATLGMAEPDRPLGGATPVATSATLGSGRAAVAELCDFAGRVFGVSFTPEAVIGEVRQSADEACGAVDYALPIPDVSEINAVDEDDSDAFDALAGLFTGRAEPTSPEELGELLRRHHLTRAILNATGDTSRPWDEVRRAVVGRTPQWGLAAQNDPPSVDLALARFVALLSIARRPSDRPLFPIEVQLWIREVSRLLRSVSHEPTFRWLDSGDSDATKTAAVELPAIYCRHCGPAGWMGLASELDGSLKHNPRPIYEASVKHSAQQRALIRASPDETDVRWLSTTDGQLHIEPDDDRLPVLVTGADDPTKIEERAKRFECPSCRNDEGIRFLGSQVASLASVSINQLFGMDARYVESDERKLLAFASSVQDASHRAGFFSGRTHRFNLRTAMARIAVDVGTTTLADLGPEVLRNAELGGARDIFALVPPDLVRDPLVATLWTDEPSPRGRAILEKRLAFEAHLEVGLRSRFGRTLELAGALTATVVVDELDALIDLVAEAHAHQTGQGVIPGTVPGYEPYLLGLLARLRQRGAIVHRWLDGYLNTDGDQYQIWGGRPSGMPAFPSGQSRPAFVTTGTSKNFDSLHSPGLGGTWLLDWAGRTLGVDPKQARELNHAVFSMLAAEDVLVARTTAKGTTVYGLDPARIEVADIAEVGDDAEVTALRCDVCVDRFSASATALPAWFGQPCLRFRCPGHYQPAPVDDANYYRHLYRNGELRRVVTAEHTSLLTRKQREALEDAFKRGDAPDAPNVITATPTLEMGIDIGDLSAVMLTSVPQSQASYVQRVGRAGRRSGNSLVTTFVRTDPRNLYYLSDPEAMIAGEVHPPNCYLDAVEILHRQYFAYLVDRAADGTIDAPVMPREIGVVVTSGLAADGWLRAILDAGHGPDVDHVGNFLALFGEHLTGETVDDLRDFAMVGLDKSVEVALNDWQGRLRELERRRDRLRDAIKRLDDQAHRSDEEERELKRLGGERRAVLNMLRTHRSEYTINALERLGLLPNYTLVDDAATLTASLWWKDDDGFHSDETEYIRNGAVAITEFAPGNTFYVAGHKLTIDALDVGTATEPLYEPWRLCPECGFGAPEKEGEPTPTCPRCGQTGIADAGARHQLIRMRHVYCTASEEGARVFDEADERERNYYQQVTSVDVDPVDIVRAYQHTKAAFGMEYARTAVIRTVNLGVTEAPGEKVILAGQELSASRFVACRYCGAVTGARKTFGEDKEFHQGWCVVRSGRYKPDWKPLNLFHELRTEVVRLLLPVSTFEVDERLASFKAALMLGLRLDFGGDPDNLDIELTDFPNPGGQGRRRLLALHDRVPGGTGYIGRVADPDRLGRILERARDYISRCICRSEGRAACHRCLLGSARPREIEFVSRSVALDLLDELLETWQFEPAENGTVAGIKLSRVDESELERRWKVAIRAWAERPDNDARLTVVPQPGATDALELRLGAGDEAPRYLIREQIEADTVPQTVPDFVITRQDAKSPDVAIYLDGFEFHASAEHNNLSYDAAKRAAVRASGAWVWNLTWDDVKAFHEAVTATVPRIAPSRPLLPKVQRGRAEKLHLARGGSLDLRAIDHNPMQLLLDLLANPDPAQWERLALSAVGGAATASPAPIGIAETDIEERLQGLLNGDHPVGSPGSSSAAMVFTWESIQGLSLVGLLDVASRPPEDERWTVIARIPDDSAAVTEPEHAARWKDYLQWANLLQFLTSLGREAVITSAAQARTLDVHDLQICPVTTGATPPPTSREISAPQAQELDLLEDSSTLTLVEAALRRGAGDFVAGFEPEADLGAGWMVEAAWPAARVAILSASGDLPDQGLLEWLEGNGWDARSADSWTVDDLIDSLDRRRHRT